MFVRKSRPVEEIEHERLQSIHKEKMKGMKCTIDNRRPKEYAHLGTNMKRVQRDKETFGRIKRENEILLTKIGNIMGQNKKDNKKKEKVVRIGGRAEINRRKELERITRENMGLLKRIQTAQPMYNHVEMQIESRRMDYLARHVAQREYVLDLVEMGNDLVRSGNKKKPQTSSGVVATDRKLVKKQQQLFSSTLK